MLNQCIKIHFEKPPNKLNFNHILSALEDNFLINLQDILNISQLTAYFKNIRKGFLQY